MRVKAAPGIEVPMEENPRSYITEDQAVEVPKNAYYLRIKSDGDLIEEIGDTMSVSVNKSAKRGSAGGE